MSDMRSSLAGGPLTVGPDCAAAGRPDTIPRSDAGTFCRIFRGLAVAVPCSAAAFLVIIHTITHKPRAIPITINKMWVSHESAVPVLLLALA
jgi:hypothetical protein